MTQLATTPSASGGSQRQPGRIGWLLLSPLIAWAVAFVVAPAVIMLVYSFAHRGTLGGVVLGFTLENYAGVLDPVYMQIVVRSIGYATITTVLCLAMGYPVAYLIGRSNEKLRNALLMTVMIPFWTSFLIRTYAWIFLLGGRGIPALLETIGLADVRLINTPFAVLVGIVYAYLPLMVFPIYVSLERLDKRLLEASADLYAGPFGSFLQVTLPLSAPGVVTGCMLVFILLMGEYLIPALLGGGKVFFVGNALVDLFLQSRNWPFGSAVAVALVAVMLVTVTLYLRLTLSNRAMRDQSLL